MKPSGRLVTEAQRRVFANLRRGREAYYGFDGMSVRGGLTRTIASMQRKGWISSQIQLTIDGNALCDQLGIERRS